MQSQRVEARVLDIVDRVVGGGRIEDDRVEAKSRWPADHRRAARQIAGLANAAAGEPIMWIVGLDEDGHRVVAGSDAEPSNWWNRVCSRFSDVAPELTLLRVPTPYGAVAALWFETTRTPYVVTTNGDGGVDREIPWRSGTALRSAHRHEILRSVIGEAQAPHLDPITGWVRAVHSGTVDNGMADGAHILPELRLTYSLKVYVEALEPVRLPEHRWSLRLAAGTRELTLDMGHIAGPQSQSGEMGKLGFARTVAVGSITYVPHSGLHVNGPDRVSINGETKIPDPHGELARTFKRAQRLELAARFPIAVSSREASMDVQLRRIRQVPLPPERALAYRHIDERVGEFSFGGGEPWRYEGRMVKVKPAD